MSEFNKTLKIGERGEKLLKNALENEGYLVKKMPHTSYKYDLQATLFDEVFNIEVKFHQKCKSSANGIWDKFNIEIYDYAGKRPGYFHSSVDIFANIDEIENIAYLYDASILRKVLYGISDYLEKNSLDKVYDKYGKITAYTKNFFLPKKFDEVSQFLQYCKVEKLDISKLYLGKIKL